MEDFLLFLIVKGFRSDTNNSQSSFHIVFQVGLKHTFLSLPFIFGVMSSSQHSVVEGTESVSDPLLSPGQSMTEGQAMSQGQYKCLELSNKDHQENRTGEDS